MKKLINFMIGFVVLPFSMCGQQKEWLQNSDLIFEGEVIKLYTSTIDYHDPSDLGIVRVTGIIEGKAILQDYLKNLITVKFKNIGEVKPGKKGIFYTTLWVSGNGLAVNEVEIKYLSDADLKSNKMQEGTRQMREQMKNDSLKQQLKMADHVVAGKVLSIKRLPENRKVESEHDPEWTEAEIEIEESLKGEFKKGARVKITFAASNDIMWFRKPKFSRGEQGIFLLRKDIKVPGNPPNFIISENELFLPVSRKDEVRRNIQ